ncbi:MAG: hypothetical protein RLZ98_2545 [Pseudomonadota bacterium]|jgi:S-adenosylmethionine-diacylgycerolhomoserine-N-methlytransferase
MDGIYRYQRYIYNATRKYYLLGRDRMLAELNVPAGGTILEPGCGTGRNLILAARRYPDAQLYGFDISSEMLKTARTAIERAGFSDRITVTEGDATNFDPQAMFGVSDFDRVFISYSLSMIPPWKEALPAAMKAVAAGGSLHIVDFGQLEGWPKFVRAGLYAWLRQFTVHPRAELEVVLGELARTEAAKLKFEKLYRGYAEYAILTR